MSRSLPDEQATCDCDKEEEGHVAEVGHVLKSDVRKLELSDKHSHRFEDGESNPVHEVALFVNLLQYFLFVLLLELLFLDLGLVDLVKMGR